MAAQADAFAGAASPRLVLPNDALHAAVLSVSAQYEPRQNDVEKRTDAYQVVTETTGLVS